MGIHFYLDTIQCNWTMLCLPLVINTSIESIGIVPRPLRYCMQSTAEAWCSTRRDLASCQVGPACGEPAGTHTQQPKSTCRAYQNDLQKLKSPHVPRNLIGLCWRLKTEGTKWRVDSPYNRTSNSTSNTSFASVGGYRTQTTTGIERNRIALEFVRLL